MYLNYTWRLIMFSVITNFYNKQTKGPTLMELFTAKGKLKKFFWQLETFDACTTGAHGCMLHSNHRLTCLIFQHTKRLPLGAAIFSLHTLTSTSWKMWTTMYRFCKYEYHGFPIISFCNHRVHYETVCTFQKFCNHTENVLSIVFQSIIYVL
jgi:hypothetical protein